MRIVVLDGYTLNPGDNPWDELMRLGDVTIHDHTPPEAIVQQCRGAQIVVTNKAPLSRPSIEALPELRCIAVTATGYNMIDIPAARERGIVVCNVPEYGTFSTAQHTIALLLELCHHVGLHAESVRAGEWVRSRDFAYWKTPLVELAGKKMGIVGFGRIGRRVGAIAHAMGMEILSSSRRRGEGAEYPFAWAEIDEIFQRCDVVTMHCPLTEETKGLVNAKRLASMKPSAFLLNTARGGLVVETDLAEALRAGRIAGYAADVIGTEPMPAGHPLLNAPRCILTPHIAWATFEARQRCMAATVENVRAFIEGRPIHVVSG
jgi:glycerate dehydrogenase